MIESFKSTPDNVAKISNKDNIVSSVKSERGEIKVGEAGGLAFIAGLFVVSEGVNKNSIPEIAIGGGISLIVLLEAVITSLRENKS